MPGIVEKCSVYLNYGWNLPTYCEYCKSDIVLLNEGVWNPRFSCNDKCIEFSYKVEKPIEAVLRAIFISFETIDFNYIISTSISSNISQFGYKFGCNNYKYTPILLSEPFHSWEKFIERCHIIEQSVLFL